MAAANNKPVWLVVLLTIAGFGLDSYFTWQRNTAATAEAKNDSAALAESAESVVAKSLWISEKLIDINSRLGAMEAAQQIYHKQPEALTRWRGPASVEDAEDDLLSEEPGEEVEDEFDLPDESDVVEAAAVTPVSGRILDMLEVELPSPAPAPPTKKRERSRAFAKKSPALVPPPKRLLDYAAEQRAAPTTF